MCNCEIGCVTALLRSVWLKCDSISRTESNTGDEDPTWTLGGALCMVQQLRGTLHSISACLRLISCSCTCRSLFCTVSVCTLSWRPRVSCSARRSWLLWIWFCVKKVTKPNAYHTEVWRTAALCRTPWDNTATELTWGSQTPSHQGVP